jgi:hypothetical protein
MINHSMLWRRIDQPGHEACRLSQAESEWRLEGTAVFSSSRRSCQLSYVVACDSNWNTRSGTVAGWVGDDRVQLEILVDTDNCWRLNGIEQPAVTGCCDLDLNFSPSTNLLPIRRLNLRPKQRAEVKAAWLRFPTFDLEPLHQVYTRLDQFTYRYSSDGGEFVAELAVNEVGFVTDYAGLWQAEL